MIQYIIAFPKTEDARNLRTLMGKLGYSDIFVCNTGAQAITYANEFDGGIVISGYRLGDMHYHELFSYLPREFLMLLIASPAKISGDLPSGMEFMELPIKVGEFHKKLEEMTEEYRRLFQPRKKQNSVVKRRSEKEKQKIKEAKDYIMESRNMTEKEAHSYLQKLSMDSGNNLSETAEMILTFKQ